MYNEKLEDDIVLAKFLNYMKKAFYHRRINYFIDLETIEEHETNIEEAYSLSKDTEIENIEINPINTNILNKKEKYLFTLLYEHGLSYNEISKITNEKPCTLKQRRNRAMLKIQRRMGDKL